MDETATTRLEEAVTLLECAQDDLKRFYRENPAISSSQIDCAQDDLEKALRLLEGVNP